MSADDHDDLPIRRTQVAATGARPPLTTAPNSIFDAGSKAKAAARAPRSPAERLAVDAIVIHKGTPLPPLRATVLDGYRTLLDRMEADTHVELPLKQARGLISTAKKFAPEGQIFRFRKLNATTAGVWRTA